MKKVNVPLLIGSLILLLIFVVMLFPDVFASNSPYTIQKIRSSIVDGSLTFESAPYPPSKDFLLGSDDMGRDILSYIVYGTRLTILLGILVALGRFLIALPIALFAGFGNKTAISIIKQFNIIFSAIPALLISIIVLSLGVFAGLDKISSMIAFTIVLSAVGWPKLSNLIMERVAFINQQPFIKGEVAIGKKRYNIAIENVIPHLAPELIVLFFMEIARSLSMIMQLGIFSVFVGNLHIIKSTDGGFVSYFNTSFEPEWAGMLSTSRTLINVAPWAVFYPALAFFISVFGFNLFGEGLRNIMQKKNSKVIPIIRKIFSSNLLTLWKSLAIRTKRRYIIAVGLMIIVIPLLLFISNDSYKFVIDNEQALLSDQVLIGTKAAENTATLIADKMALLNIKPMEDDKYIIDYDINQACITLEHIFTINNNDAVVSPQYNEEYTFVDVGNHDYTGQVYDATNDDLFTIDDYLKFSNKFILIDQAYYNDAALNFFIKNITDQVDIKGVLLIARDNEIINNVVSNKNDDIFIVLLSRELSNDILNNSSSTITISASVKTLEAVGHNIVGIYEGLDYYSSEEAIVIGLSYNYLDENGEDILQFNLALMEKICTLYENKRSIIFMFLDGTLIESFHGASYMSQNFPYSSSKTKVYIDLTGLTKSNFDTVEFSSAQAPMTRQLAWSIGHLLEKQLIENHITINEIASSYVGSEHYFTGSYVDNVMFWDRGIATIIINTSEEGQKKHSINDIGSILTEIINKSNY